MAWSWKRAGIGAGSGALQGLQAGGNPYVIGGNAALQGLIGGMSGQPEFDPQPFLNQFQDYKKSVLSDLGSQTRDIVSGVNTDLASRGLQYSPMGAGIAKGTDTALRTSALRQLRGQEHDLRMDLQQAQLVDDRQQSNVDRSALAELGARVGGVAIDVASGEKSANPNIRGIRERLGMPVSKMVNPSSDAVDRNLNIDMSVPSPKRDMTEIQKDQTDFGAGTLPPTAPSGSVETGKDSTEFAVPDSEIPRPDYIPQGMNQTDDFDLFDLELPMSEDMFELTSNTGTNANMISIDGTDFSVPADSSFGKVYKKYKPRFDLLHTQLSGGILEFIDAFTMPDGVLQTA